MNQENSADVNNLYKTFFKRAVGSYLASCKASDYEENDYSAPFCPVIEMANQSSHFSHNPKTINKRERERNNVEFLNNPNLINSRFKKEMEGAMHHFVDIQWDKNQSNDEHSENIGLNRFKRKGGFTKLRLGHLEAENKKKGSRTGNNRYESLIGGDITNELVDWASKMRISSLDRVVETDIIGLLSVKKIIKSRIINPILRPDLHKGLYSPTRGILFFGPPGTGKTTLAKWIGYQSNATFFQVSPSSITSKYHGETESIIRTLFVIAEYDSPSIIFIDEIDSLLSKRRSSDDDHSVRMKTQLLQMMDGLSNRLDCTVVVIGATNRPEVLDEAGLRRFGRRILIPLPDCKSRVLFIKSVLNKNKNSFELDGDEFDEISDKTNGWSNTDLLNLCSKAAEYSYDEAIEEYDGIENIPDVSVFRPININDFRNSLNDVHPSSTANKNYEEWELNRGAR